jgi:uncharacterized damage-inducible protein DinB
MKTFLVAALMCAGTLLAADAPALTVAQMMDNGLKQVEGEVVPLAEAMPAEKYAFAPKDGAFKNVRTFAQQMKHIATVNYEVAAAMLGEKSPVSAGKNENGDDAIASKDQIVKYLKDSFAYTHKAMATLTATNLTGLINSPFGEGKAQRLSMATVPAWHTFDHYGQAVVYARMCSVVPPASR